MGSEQNVTAERAPVDVGSQAYTSDRIDALAGALARAQGRIETAKKGSDNPFFGSRYADLAELWLTARAALSTEGIAVFQPLHSSPDGLQLWLTTLLVHGASGQWTSSRVRIRVPPRDRKILRDGTGKPREQEIEPSPADKEDDLARRPQVMGSAITYWRRYTLASMLLLTAHGEDDDANAAEGRRANRGPATGAPDWKLAKALPCPACGNTGAIGESKDSPGTYYCGKSKGGCGVSPLLLADDKRSLQAPPSGPGAAKPAPQPPNGAVVGAGVPACAHCGNGRSVVRNSSGAYVCVKSRGGCDRPVSQ